VIYMEFVKYRLSESCEAHPHDLKLFRIADVEPSHAECDFLFEFKG